MRSSVSIAGQLTGRLEAIDLDVGIHQAKMLPATLTLDACVGVEGIDGKEDTQIVLGKQTHNLYACGNRFERRFRRVAQCLGGIDHAHPSLGATLGRLLSA